MTGQEFSSFLGERGKILTRNRTGWRTAKRNVNVARAVASSLISLKREDVTPDGRTDGRTNGWTAGLTRGLVMIVILQLVRSLSECCLSSSLSLTHTHTHIRTNSLCMFQLLPLLLHPLTHVHAYTSIVFLNPLTPSFCLCTFYADACLPIKPRNVELIKRANPLCEY